MKKIFNLILGLFVTIFIFSGCEDKTDLTAPPTPTPKSGNVDLTRYVSIGNSLTSGYQSSALYASAQAYSYPNLIAKQVNTTFVQPLIADPGIGGQIEIATLNPFTTKTEPVLGGAPLNLNYPAPYNNLGVPGVVLADVMNSTSTSNSYSKSPFIDIILRGQGTQFAQAKALHPTFLTLWIGNNDVLGFAASGGYSPKTPTDAQTFAYLYSQLCTSIDSLGAKVVVANIPDVTSIPFFTTVGPMIAQKLSSLQISGMYYQQHGQYSGTALPVSSLADGTVLITLVGQTYAGLIGTPTGKFYRDNKADISLLIAGGIIDTTQPFGLSPKNPWPDALILDAGEIQTAKTATAAFNSSISALATAHGYGLVDINSFLSNVRKNDFKGGTVINGITFYTTFVTGGVFSLDGIHPTNQGQAIIANEFIKVINSKFGASIPLIDVATIPGSFVLSKRNLISGSNIPYFAPGTFNNLLF